MHHSALNMNGQELQRTKLLWELTFNESTIQTPLTRSNNEGNTSRLTIVSREAKKKQPYATNE